MTASLSSGKRRLLAIASGGGHWIQLLRLRDAFAGFDVAYVSMFDNYAEAVPGARFHTVSDASRFNLRGFGKVWIKAIIIMIKERPHAIVTTGAAPMLCFLILGRLIGSRTLWIDSIANAERLSTSGWLARKIAHCTVSQWPDVAEREGVPYWGAII
jgi:UDP-N-acetylglucosamine:LPS N-acetylglucosamine transferase